MALSSNRRLVGFPESVLDAARALIRRGAVFCHAGVGRAGGIYGRVDDDTGTPAYVVVRLPEAGRRGASVEGSCSRCGVAHCVHAAAVTLAHVEREPDRRARRPDAQDHDVGHWLRSLSSAIDDRPDAGPDPSRRAAGPAGSPTRVVYIVSVAADGRLLTVHPQLAAVGKDGVSGALKNCAYTGGANRPLYATPVDRELLTTILAVKKTGWIDGFRAPVAIEPTAAAGLLRRLIRTGRCHWRDVRTAPLGEGPARSARFEWMLADDGSQRPRLVFDAGDGALVGERGAIVGIQADPLLYVETRENLAGELTTDLAPGVALALLVAPSIPADEIERVRTTLRDVAASDDAHASVPLPVTIAEETVDVACVPRLHMTLHTPSPPPWLQDRLRTNRPVVMAILHFDYGGVRVSCDDRDTTLRRREGTRLLTITRDRDAERAAAQRLLMLGLVDLTEIPGVRDELGAPAGAFLPDDDTMDAMVRFARHEIPDLERDGWVVTYDDSFPYRVIEGDAAWYAEIDEPGTEWFDLELGVEIDGERHNLLPIIVDLLRRRGLDFTAHCAALADSDDDTVAVRAADGRIVLLPGERVRTILGTLTELFADAPLTGGDRLRLALPAAGRLNELETTMGAGALAWSGGEQARALARTLDEFSGLAPVALPASFRGELRPYQHAGLAWLQFLREHGLAGVLADDMGLGKTVQLLAHLAVEKAAGRADRPSLVVAPTSVLSNWRREAERFTPELSVLTLHGQSRARRFAEIDSHDLVLTTYPLLSRDAETLTAQRFHALVLDEAQFVKNPKSQAWRVAAQLEARHRLCLTGTPMENHLGELWSLFQLLLPGFLGDSRQFRKLFRTPIERHHDGERRRSLAVRVRPFLLRRTKDEVARDLPPKSEITQTVELGRTQRDLYESIRLAMHDKVQQAVASKGLGRSSIVILDALLKLRQVCCDPRLLKLELAKEVRESAKLDVLLQMLDEMLEEGRRVLVFSQFATMIGLIEEALAARGVEWVTLTGQTRDRDTPIGRFQRGEVPLFLVSLKAGGTGLNLTAADTVIHFDPWWNPAVEDQATDRAHRIGQDKPVFVYRLIVAGSVEEKMLAMQGRKRELAAGVYAAQGDTHESGGLSREDLEVLFRPLGE